MLRKYLLTQPSDPTPQQSAAPPPAVTPVDQTTHRRKV